MKPWWNGFPLDPIPENERKMRARALTSGRVRSGREEANAPLRSPGGLRDGGDDRVPSRFHPWWRRCACGGTASVRMGGVTPNERPTVQAHREVAAVLQAGDQTIDATAGNGHDTVFLAERVGDSGKVLAFDVQAEAIVAARDRVAVAGLTARVEFIHGSHAALPEHAAPGSVAAVMFNLGYFPGGDHAVITRTAETLTALDAALVVLKPGGILTVVCYPGHPGGDEESAAVTAWSEGLAAADFDAAVTRRTDTLRPSPFLVSVWRK